MTNNAWLVAATPVTFTSVTNLTNSGGEVYTATSGGANQTARGMIDPVVIPANTDGWIEAAKGSGGDGAYILTLDAGAAGAVSYGLGDFIAQVNTAGALFYGENVTSLTQVAGYTAAESLACRTRLRRIGASGVVVMETTEDGGATWTNRRTFTATSTAALQARWYTTYSVTPRRLRQPRGIGLMYVIANSIQGQWVAPNILRAATSDFVYVGSAGTGGQFRVSRINATTLATDTTTIVTREQDDHNIPALVQTNSGKIMAACATHSLRALIETKLSASANDDDWGSVRNLVTSGTATYNQLHRLAGADRIWMLYRIGSSSAGDWVMVYSDDEGATWSSERLLAPNTYVISVPDPDGVHIRCFGYAHPQAAGDHDIYYFRVDLATGDVVDSQDNLLGNVVTDTGLPLTTAEMHKAVDVTAPTTTRMYELGRVSVPALLASEFIDETGGTYCRYAYNTSTGLFTRSPIVSSGPAFFAATSDYFGGVCFDEASLNTVYAARNLGASVGVGSWQLVKFSTVDNGASWQSAGVMHSSANIIARPQMRFGRLWWSEVTSYPAYTNFAATVRSIALP